VRKKSNNIKNVIWVILTNGISSFFQFLLIINITKIFGVEAVGMYSSSTAIILPIITFFMGLNLMAIQLTDVDLKYNIADYFVVRFIGAIISAIIILLILFVKNQNDSMVIITLILLMRYISSLFSEISNNQMIKIGNYNKYAASIISRSVLSVSLFYISAIVTDSLIIGLIFYAIIWIAIFFIMDFKNVEVRKAFRDYTLSYSKTFNLIITCLPLAFVSTINVLYDSIPRYFIEYYIGLEALGIFSATLYFSLIGGLFVTGVTLTFANKLAMLYKDGNNKKFIKIVFIQEVLVIAFCLMLLILFYVKGEMILELIFNAEFIEYLDVVLILLVAMSLNFMARVLGTAATAMGKNKNQLWIALLCILVLSASCWILIPQHQLIGAGVAVGITYFFKYLLLLIVISKNFIRKKELTL
jgi:O-antigen/teichoic acid export membrane protein